MLICQWKFSITDWEKIQQIGKCQVWNKKNDDSGSMKCCISHQNGRKLVYISVYVRAGASVRILVSKLKIEWKSKAWKLTFDLCISKLILTHEESLLTFFSCFLFLDVFMHDLSSKQVLYPFTNNKPKLKLSFDSLFRPEADYICGVL